MNCYEILGVEPSATLADIKSAFRRAARECHPDHHPHDKNKEERFKRVSAAYEVLSDDERRRQYDQSLAEEQRRVRARQQGAHTGSHQAKTRATSAGLAAMRTQGAAPSFSLGELVLGGVLALGTVVLGSLALTAVLRDMVAHLTNDSKPNRSS